MKKYRRLVSILSLVPLFFTVVGTHGGFAQEGKN